MRQELGTFDDFQSAKTIIEEEIESKGHMCVFLPKFHCELNPIERVWCHAKKHVKANNSGSVTRLRKLVPEALATMDEQLIFKFCDSIREYERAYSDIRP